MVIFKCKLNSRLRFIEVLNDMCSQIFLYRLSNSEWNSNIIKVSLNLILKQFSFSDKNFDLFSSNIFAWVSFCWFKCVYKFQILAVYITGLLYILSKSSFGMCFFCFEESFATCIAFFWFFLIFMPKLGAAYFSLFFLFLKFLGYPIVFLSVCVGRC